MKKKLHILMPAYDVIQDCKRLGVEDDIFKTLNHIEQGQGVRNTIEQQTCRTPQFGFIIHFCVIYKNIFVTDIIRPER